MIPLIILVTGARKIEDVDQAENMAWSLLVSKVSILGHENVLVVHGGAPGWDTVFETVATNLGVRTVPFPAKDYPSPLDRNTYMAGQVARWGIAYHYDVECWSFANDWASGTGHCARRARHYGIKVIDYGVSTGERK